MSSIFKSYSPEEQAEVNSNFLVDSWSYSKVMQFARNEKAFEMIYIYHHRQKTSATTIAGQAYHYALQHYFQKKKEGIQLSLPEAEILAFNYIDEVPLDQWKLQKTTDSIAACKKKANKTVISLLQFFFQEKYKYEDYILRIIDVEVFITEYVTINGVDIPIRVNLMIDLVVETIEHKIAIVDHKSKASYTPDDEIAMAIGKQAITYIKGYEASTGLHIDEVWFAENKHSGNKDGKGQIVINKVILDDDSRKLYEYQLYEPLRRMLNAVRDPDYIYLINDSDNFTDRAEIYKFWHKTLIAEVTDFDIPENKKDMIEKRLKKIKDSSVDMINPKIIKEFQKNAASFIQYDLSNTDMSNQEKIEHILRKFGVQTRVAHHFDGYSSDTYLMEVSAGTRISSVQKYKLDIANALNVTNVRIPMNLTIYEEKSYLSVEHSKKRTRDLFWNPDELKGFKIPMGKDNLNNTVYWDLDNPSTPHLLMGGGTGSGKSVSLISTLEYLKLAGVNQFYILDPKLEFTKFQDKNTRVYNDMGEIEQAFEMLVDLMNEKIATKNHDKVVILFDEIAAAIEEAGKRSTIEASLKKITQKGRSCGMRVIAATQRASVKTISGDIKVNFPVVVCFRVGKEIDSKVMLDEAGAETLAGFGDGLIKSPDYPEITRFQSFFKE